MTTITRERVAEIIHAAGLEPCDYEEVFGSIKTGEIVAMARIALASLEAEAVAIVEPSDYVTAAQLVGEEPRSKAVRPLFEGALSIGQKLYTAPPAPVVDCVPLGGSPYDVPYSMPSNLRELIAEEIGILFSDDDAQSVWNVCRSAAMLQGSQPVSKREKVRREHAEWSDATFGNVGPVGPLKHLSKEALEAAAEPGDLSEWADMQFLLWDAQKRAGISDDEITAAMEEKLKVNMARQWPEPKDGEPRLHIKEQSESVLPEIECDICGHVSTDPEGRHHCCEDNSND